MIYLNDELVQVTVFPNGETLINSNQLKVNENNIITLKYVSDYDLINLMFVKKTLDDYMIKEVDLIIKYMPYSRMDRTNEKRVFTLKYVADFINQLNFSSVEVWEAHSDVTLALLDRCLHKNISIYLAKKLIKDIGFDKEKDYIYFPDTTANKRYSDHFLGYKQITGFKKRDFMTGEILSLKLLGDIEGQDYKVVMIDDLCSGGTTFYFGAKAFKERGAKNIYLAVAHCENTVYNGKLFNENAITQIYTTDSILTNFSEDRIKICEVTS